MRNRTGNRTAAIPLVGVRGADRARFADPAPSKNGKRLPKSHPDYVDLDHFGWLLTNTERRVAHHRNDSYHWEKIAQDLCYSVARVQQIHRSAKHKIANAVAPPTAATKKRPGFVYFIRSGDHIKIGYATNVADRIRELQVGNPTPLQLLGVMPAARPDEKRLHGQFAQTRIVGEWFQATPVLIDYIKANTTRAARFATI